jgi:phosphatidylinositol phospholipase C, delta
MHGFTLTRPVGFREVCKAIREEAFKTNDLPIIVSLQVGATKEQQEVMVDIMKEEWDNLLLDKPHETCNPRHRQPRLDELLQKILVKVKRAPEKDDSTVNPTHLSPHQTHETSAASQEEEERLVATGAQKKRGKIEPICDNLSRLAVYTHSEHFDNLDSPGAKLPGHIFSLSEKQIERLHATKRKELHRHNSNFFMRAYPNPIRIDSSNPDPSFFWRRGVQMVALNWQNLDEGMMVNGGMFSGEKGWVLKTDAYRNESATPLSPTSPVTTASAEQRLLRPQRTLDLRITVFAGQHIPLPPTQEKPHQGQSAVGGARSRHYKPYVKCALHVEKADKGDMFEGGIAKGAENGHAGSTTGHSSTARDVPYKQQTKPGDTDHPNFGPNGQILEFNNIRGVIEELSFVR